MAEIVLTARVELDVGRHHRAVFLQEANEAAIVIDMPVADDHRLDLRRIDLEQIHIVENCRGVAEVEQDRAVLCAALRFQIQREAPFIVQHVARARAASGSRSFVRHAIDSAAA